MRIALIISLIACAGLTACTNQPNTLPTNSGATTATSSVSTSQSVVVSGSVVKVDYTGRFEDGTIFDSSRQEDAMKGSNYSSGRTYEPISFQIGAGQMIPGFENSVIGMKVGEKKTITIVPKDAYGEATMEQDIPREVIESRFTRTVEKEQFADTITRTVPTSMLGEKGVNIKKGEKIDANGVQATVLDLASGSVTLSIENTQNPFYKKGLKVGTTAEVEKNIITIKSLTETGVTIEVENKSSPFYGKELTSGLEAPLPQAGSGSTIKILSVTQTGATVIIPNPHPLAGKTLIFDVELKDITK